MSNMQIGGVASSYNPTAEIIIMMFPLILNTLGVMQREDKLFTIIYEDGSITNDT